VETWKLFCRFADASVSVLGSNFLILQHDLLVDGYIAQSFGPIIAQRYLYDLLKVNQQQCSLRQLCQAIPRPDRPGAVTFVVGAVATRQPPPPLMQDHNGRPLWLLDYSIAPTGTVVPQALWSPQDVNDFKQYVTDAELQMPIFFTQENGHLGLSLDDAANGRCHTLRGARAHVHLGGQTTTFIRIKVCSHQPNLLSDGT
jgi:hypothetical protein